MAAKSAPQHPVAQMQGAFEESMRETMEEPSSTSKNPYLNADKVQRRKLLLDSPQYERTVGGKWVQKRGENFHPLWKLVAQISFGMHLLQTGMARSDEEVINLLQSHVDEVDGFLERTTEDFELAQQDITERIRYLKLPLEHGEVFDSMLTDRAFRTAIVEGNEKIEHIVNRTTIAMKDALKDVQKGLDGTKELARFLRDLDRRWRDKSEEHEAVYTAMMGNTEGWDGAYKGIQMKGSELGISLVQLEAVISELQRRAGFASRRNLPSSNISSSRQSQQISSPKQYSQPSSAQRTAPRQLSPMMSPIHEQEPALKEPEPQVTEPKRKKPMETSKLWVAELPADANPRKSIHALMTAEALSVKSTSTPASETSFPPLPSHSEWRTSKSLDTKDSETREDSRSSYISKASGGDKQTDEDSEHGSREEEEPITKWEDDKDSEENRNGEDEKPEAAAVSTASEASVAKEEEEEEEEEKDDEVRKTEEQDMAPDQRRSQEDLATAAMPSNPSEQEKEEEEEEEEEDVKEDNHNGNDDNGSINNSDEDGEEASNPFASPDDNDDNDDYERTPSKTIISDPARSPQMEGQTFFGYASSDADTGSIEARSTPGKGRSRSTTNSQHQVPPQLSYNPTGLSFMEPYDGSDEAIDFAGDEEGIVNHKHPIFQDIRGRDNLSQEIKGLKLKHSNESMSSTTRRNSFRESDSSAKLGAKSQAESPISGSNRASDNTVATPVSLSGTDASSSGHRASDTVNTTSRPRTQIGQAPPIVPAPVQTSDLGSKKSSPSIESPPSPSLAELTSATVSGPDMGDPFAPYTSSINNKPKHKHQALMDRIEGALQESANKDPGSMLAQQKSSSPKRHSRVNSKSQNKSVVNDNRSHQNPSTSVTTTTVTSRPTSLYNPAMITTTTTTNGNSYYQTTTTATRPVQAVNGQAPRTLSPFRVTGLRQRDRTPEGQPGNLEPPGGPSIQASPSKRGVKKFFSMKRRKKDAHENF